MGYVATFENVIALFPEAIVVASATQMNQSGIYLILNGTSVLNNVSDEMSFTIAIVANTMIGENSTLSTVEKIRQKIFDTSIEVEFKGCKSIVFETNTMFAITLMFSAVSYNI